MFWIAIAFILPLLGVPLHYCLLLGIILAVVISTNTLSRQISPSIGEQDKKYSKYFLNFGVAILGASLPLTKILSLGLNATLITLGSIIFILMLSWFIQKFLNLDEYLWLLLGFGTAICGGSAIAALAATLKARDNYIAVSLILVFLLNGLALFIFPELGRVFELDDIQFGLWAALSIHDTSSVVGAAALWSDQALAVATPHKLIRALWIVPFVLFISKIKGVQGKTKVPTFIIAFFILSLAASLFAIPTLWVEHIAKIAKMAMASSLFLIGLGLKLDDLKKLGAKPVVFAILLWISVSGLTLILIKSKMIQYQFGI
tara:strand:- start:18851 stop:19801 length:951 start_codon:yes stop_codon:yes gene_type:complete